ncbi:polysaccharide deacetylase family protein [Nonomuraea jabiensis]|uniref:Peptidoglycan/xylan/chitin deacetylase (PgdA/CDA1 family) n=1 Tax=Nonomuraea jabiensis TaxID=882448 RepID=A0A7W9LAD5_9ACTN|nr:polysaccharide deacetylase family protein [Nonomuraea jabiensis]MBB5776560.1 peptidoglycan/xylan/chitin deacetylase (PgdA/CDA1 family) [Nonomuraea jabiensis]
MHKLRFFSGIALLALSATACGLAAASPGRDVVVPAEPTMIDFVDPAAVAGLSTRTLTDGHYSGNRYVHISYPEFQNAPALNRALRAEAERKWRDFGGRTKGRAAYSRPELNVDWQLAAASPQAIAVRLRTGEFQGAGWAYSTRTYWFDRRGGKVAESAGLLDGEHALRQLAQLVQERLKGRGSQVEREEVAAGGDRFDSMAFNRDGDLVVEFDDCQIGPCSLGRLAVAILAERVRPLLSEFGRRAQDSVREAARQVQDSMREAARQAQDSMREAARQAQDSMGEAAKQAPIRRPGTAPTESPQAVSNQAGTVDCAKAKCVALTFDDGPGPYTAKLLDILRKERARATFFVVGSNAAAQPGLLKRMSAEGHLVGNHTWDHKDLSKQATSRITDSLARTEEAVSAAIGQRPALARPPYGTASQAVRDVAAELGLALVEWDVDADDLFADKAGDITDLAVRKAHPGAIILMHDIHRETVDAVPDILKRLRGKGYSFVTVPELYGSAGMQAGHLYRSGSELPGKRPLT